MTDKQICKALESIRTSMDNADTHATADEIGRASLGAIIAAIKDNQHDT